MSLETLRGVKVLGGFEVVELEQPMPRREFVKEIKKKFVWVNHANNTISFKIQDGPVKDKGVNGCQVEALIHAAFYIISRLNEKIPHSENVNALEGLSEAHKALRRRTSEREKRCVEGTMQK